MKRWVLLMTTIPLLWAGPRAACSQAALVVIGHPSLEKIDLPTLQRVFTGRVVEVGGQPVTPINAAAGSSIRETFLQVYLQQDEQRYVAYWTVRRYIGKGVPPRELASSDDVIRFVRATPGAIGYVPEAGLPPDIHVLLR